MQTHQEKKPLQCEGHERETHVGKLQKGMPKVLNKTTKQLPSYTNIIFRSSEGTNKTGRKRKHRIEQTTIVKNYNNSNSYWSTI